MTTITIQTTTLTHSGEIQERKALAQCFCSSDNCFRCPYCTSKLRRGATECPADGGCGGEFLRGGMTNA